MKGLKIFFLLATLLTMMLIFHFSQQPSEESNNVSTEITDKIVDISLSLTGVTGAEEKKERLVQNLNGVVRQYAHFTLFTVLGIMSVLFFRFDIYGKWGIRVWIAAIVFCTFYAVTDEIHQIFVPGRSCEVVDVLTDTAGSFLGSGLVFFYAQKMKKTKE